MPNDLPAAIRAALLEDEIDEGDLLQPTLATPPPHHAAARWAVTAAVAAVAVLGIVLGVTLPGHHSDTTTGPPANGHPVSQGYVGYRWTVTTIRDRAGTVAVPRGLHPAVAFSPDGAVQGDDTLNTLSGSYTRTRTGYTVHGVGSTAVGYDGYDRTRTRVITAVDAVFVPSTAVRASTTADTLRLQRGPYVLVLRRAGTQPDAPQPSSTATTTTG